MRRNSQNVNSMLYYPQNPRPTAGGFVEIDAFAKINLFLEVTDKRVDGYHNIESVMQALMLCDHISISKCKASNDLVQLQTTNPYLPTNEKNLAVKAAMLLMKEYNINEPILIKLNKRIPIGAGLGGGSSNAAATMHGINQLFNLGIPLNKLIEIGTTIGADVPFCLTGGTAMAEGIGEILTPLAPLPSCYVLLACLPVHVSTRTIFESLQYTKRIQPLSISNFLAAYETQNIEAVANNFYNVFTQITSKKHPQILPIISEMQRLGAIGASMTGTGATVFAYFKSGNNAKKARNILMQQGIKVFVTRTI